jgi:hypothetical protein
MSVHVMTGGTRQSSLARLREEIHGLGGSALLALSSTAHPVLYVRAEGRLVPVVVVQGITGGWWFIWGRTGQAHISQTARAATALCGHRQNTRSRVNPVPARRSSLREAA